MTNNERIHLYTPEITKDELVNAVSSVYDSGVYTRGGQVSGFEKKLSETVGSMDALAVSNGTTALNLAVRAANWGAGDKVITSPMSFIATTNVLLQEGVIPVFGEIDNDLQLDWDEAKSLLEKDSSIVGILMPVIYGHQVDVEAIQRIRAAFPELIIVEDAAQALALKSMNLGVGETVDMTTYSFHENKVITTMGEGGGVVSDNSFFIENMRRMREQGRVDTPEWLSLVELGYNYRMTEAQAHTGTAQLERLDDILSKREQLAKRMSGLLLNSELPIRVPSPNRSWFAYPIVAQSAEDAATIAKVLNDTGISARLNPMPAIQSFNHVARSEHEDHSRGIEDLAKRVILLPLHTKMNEDNVDRIVDTLKTPFSKKGGGSSIKSSATFYDSLARQYESVRAERTEYIHAVNQVTIDTILSHRSTTPQMLDVGCGDGVRAKEIARTIGYSLVATDSSSQMVRVAQLNNVEALESDITIPDERLYAKGKFGAVTVLWNVLGHISEERNRIAALRNIRSLLSDDGVLVIDVNNQFNETQYGKESVLRNRKAVEESDGDTTVGDFTTTRTDHEGNSFSTTSHIFYTGEIISLLESAGFLSTVKYINYTDGKEADESSGQIVVTAVKKN